jgi:hypothetical protein
VRSLDRKRLAEIGDKAQKLGELKEHPSWKLLYEIFEKKRERYFTKLARDLMAPRGPKVDELQLEWDRGYWAGVFHVLDNPERAEATFEAALKKAHRFADDERE